MSESEHIGVSGLATDPATSYRMRQVGQSETEPELAVRSILREVGHHYRLKNRDLPGNPDMANRSQGWVIFVHGCFWHGHDECRRAQLPKRNRSYWKEKIEKNQTRDRRVVSELEAMGYSVLTIWECELGSREDVKSAIVEQIGDRLLDPSAS